MYKSKYKKILTVVLILLVIVIIGLIAFFGYEKYQKQKNDKEASAAIDEFDRIYNVKEETKYIPEVEDMPSEYLEQNPEVEQTSAPTKPSSGGSSYTRVPTSSGNNSSSSSSTSMTYKGFAMIGYIQIPSTGIKQPILDVITPASFEASVVAIYPAPPQLNEPGNVVIAGHNYRNKMFFSNNKKLKAGDKIYIADQSGRKLEYTVYDNFEASPSDTSFYTRDTGGVPEITLTTCTNDVNIRTIILARAE